ncbi:Aflatoxin B1 aldehyde reductase member 4 [Cladophialophora carrionii]|uniref:Aflatoxin B1 aldehyde reductase member 4 n=1 Tax=Cladophialophora carrionii TaxID=86049 RepID=A0A1C1CMC0_9EURO|nr:Aflatoxin B1 aldehyde reductase member 4 [Cladophialophora carrionii]
MASQGIKVVFGAASIGNREPWIEKEYLEKAFDILLKHGVNTLDSAQLYGESEKRLGELNAGDKFIIDTKWMGGWQPGWATKENIVNTAKSSIEKLKVKQVDIFYIHSPDSKIDLEETLAGVNEVYKTGVFKRFGLSNYSPADVQKVYDIAKEKGYVLPTVYQGNYSPVARRQETELFPVLRNLGIAFYAYSPLAGGFLTKTAQQIKDGVSRFAPDALGGMYRDMYMKPSYLDALSVWEAIANEEGVTRAELAYRWVTYHSPLKKEQGDAIIVGASSTEQLEQSLTGIEKGPLSSKAAEGIDKVWDQVKHEAPLDNFTR